MSLPPGNVIAVSPTGVTGPTLPVVSLLSLDVEALIVRVGLIAVSVLQPDIQAIFPRSGYFMDDVIS